MCTAERGKSSSKRVQRVELDRGSVESGRVARLTIAVSRHEAATRQARAMGSPDRAGRDVRPPPRMRAHAPRFHLQIPTHQGRPTRPPTPRLPDHRVRSATEKEASASGRGGSDAGEAETTVWSRGREPMAGGSVRKRQVESHSCRRERERAYRVRPSELLSPWERENRDRRRRAGQHKAPRRRGREREREARRGEEEGRTNALDIFVRGKKAIWALASSF